MSDIDYDEDDYYDNAEDDLYWIEDEALDLAVVDSLLSLES